MLKPGLQHSLACPWEASRITIHQGVQCVETPKDTFMLRRKGPCGTLVGDALVAILSLVAEPGRVGPGSE